MVFSSLSFLLIFLPAVLAVYYLVPRAVRNTVLFLASIVFYALGEPCYVFLFLGVILWSYLFGLLIERSGEKPAAKGLFVLCLAGDLGALCLFKYAAFFVRTFVSLTGLDLPVPKAVLPIGISFYTFQAISYMADVRRSGRAQKNLISLGLYLAFFPQLIAGPIVRYDEIRDQIAERRTTAAGFGEGAVRLAQGLTKKVLLANTLGQLADHVFRADLSLISTPMLWLGAIAYTLQIYYDFSGYSDMAIGLGRLFGFRLPENFDHPYAAPNATEFWRRWHMSLSRWFRDYVYIPLGGSRQGMARQIRNLLIVWALTGFWHGAGWTFILWGLLWGLALILEKFLVRPSSRGKAVRVIWRAVFLLFMMLLWVIFRSKGIGAAGLYIKGLFVWQMSPARPLELSLWFKDMWPYLTAGVVFATGLPGRLKRRLVGEESSVRQAAAEAVILLGRACLVVIALSLLVSGSYNPFLYFNF